VQEFRHEDIVTGGAGGWWVSQFCAD
jgi:hypothetical protein